MPVLNRSSEKHYSKYYDKRSRSLVEKNNLDLIKDFNYAFESNTENNNLEVVVTIANKDNLNDVKQLLASVYLYGNWKGNFGIIAENLMEEDTSWFLRRGVFVLHVKNKPKAHLFSNYFKRLYSCIDLYSTV